MAITRRSSSQGQTLSQTVVLERRWDDIKAAFNRYDGSAVAALMRAAWTDSPKSGNFCKVRLEAAMVSWFRDHGLGFDGDHPDVDFSREAMAAFMLRLFPDVEPASAVTVGRIPRIVFAMQRHNDSYVEARGVPVEMIRPEDVQREIDLATPGSKYSNAGAERT